MSIFHDFELRSLCHFFAFEHQTKVITQLAAPRLEAEDVFPLGQ